MLSARLVAIALVGFVLLALVAGVVVSWLPPGPRRVAPDSYSGRVTGHRALLETLHALGAPARRSTHLPTDLFSGERRVLLIEPSIRRLEREQAYLAKLEAWIEGGGELVVVFSPDEEKPPPTLFAHDPEEEDEPDEDKPESQFRRRLGVEGLDVAQAGMEDEEELGYGLKSLRHKRPTVACATRGTGTLAALASQADPIHVCADPPGHFVGEPVAQADASIEISPDGETWYPLVLEYARGGGRVILVADPVPFSNVGITEGGNSLLAYRLATGTAAREVIVDEFYHGGLDEGNWLALIGMYPFGVIALFVLAAALSWVWANAVRFGPPEKHTPVSRRSIHEYIEAMAHLFWRGRKGSFVLKTCRDGFLDTLRAELCVGPGTPPEALLQRLQRHEPERARLVQAVLDTTAAALQQPTPIPTEYLVEFQEEFQRCQSSTMHQAALRTRKL